MPIEIKDEMPEHIIDMVQEVVEVLRNSKLDEAVSVLFTCIGVVVEQAPLEEQQSIIKSMGEVALKMAQHHMEDHCTKH